MRHNVIFIGPPEPRTNARKRAAVWMTVPAEERRADRLIQEIQGSGMKARIDATEETERIEAEQLAPWLVLVRAPCRVFLVAQIETMRD